MFLLSPAACVWSFRALNHILLEKIHFKILTYRSRPGVFFAYSLYGNLTTFARKLWTTEKDFSNQQSIFLIFSLITVNPDQRNNTFNVSVFHYHRKTSVTTQFFNTQLSWLPVWSTWFILPPTNVVLWNTFKTAVKVIRNDTKVT